MPAIIQKDEDGSDTVLTDWRLFEPNLDAAREQRMLEALEYIAGAVGILAKAKLDEPAKR